MALAFDVVVAVDRDRGIAREGAIPWHLPGDMAHFKQLTSAARPGRTNAVIMGRKTWESIPERFRPLSGRCNVVLSRSSELALPEGVLGVGSLDEALRLAAEPARGIARVFVIGGASVYAEAMARSACRDLYVTRVDGSFGCDTFFPSFEHFNPTSVLHTARENDIDYRIEVWRNLGFAP